MIKRSISIGLNYQGSENELPDCHLDATRIQARANDAGYTPHLRLGKFSVSDFVDEIERLKRDAKHTDTTLISFSGHGTQYEDPSSPELDFIEEGLCFDGGGFIEVLDDDDFRLLINSIPGTVFVFLDSCFSGGMQRVVRSPREWKRKFVPFDPAFKIVEYVPDYMRTVKTPHVQKRYFLFASAENEVSWSTGEGGLFTNSFCQIYDALPAKRRTIANLMRGCVTLCGQEQTPNYRSEGGNGAKRVF